MSNNARRLLLGTATVVVVIIGLVIIAATVGSDRTVTNLGDEVFGDIRAERVVRDVAEGGPVFYPDLTDGRRDIWVTHVGDDPSTGFLVLLARAPSGCLIQWDPAAGDFYDICDETVRFAADGTGLEQYPYEIDDGKLIIDLNFADRDISG